MQLSNGIRSANGLVFINAALQCLVGVLLSYCQKDSLVKRLGSYVLQAASMKTAKMKNGALIITANMSRYTRIVQFLYMAPGGYIISTHTVITL